MCLTRGRPAEHMEHWNRLSYVAMGISGTFTLYSLLFMGHEHKEDTTPYPHMKCAVTAASRARPAAGSGRSLRIRGTSPHSRAPPPLLSRSMRERAMPWDDNCDLLDTKCRALYYASKAEN